MKFQKYQHNEHQQVFFSSDWHVFHDPKWDNPIWKMRGYESAEHSAREIQSKVNERVREQDLLFYLGDGFLNSSPDQVREWLRGIKCQNIFYIWGNHESSMFKIYKDSVGELEYYPHKLENVTFLGWYNEIFVNNKRFILSHYPFRVWNQLGRSYALSGHSHYGDKSRRAEAEFDKALDIGWDGKLDIYSFDEIMSIMNKKKMRTFDHHDSETN